ncbi:MAG: hypothetical protein Tp1125DCM00d2C21254131_31 [Prokaryotic dsDNA virus sp.]|nr:MAG: hypothetical protein Tp1125DCM00d2C21254131_31 [Prokaryotic dsDNA virus sp.]
MKHSYVIEYTLFFVMLCVLFYVAFVWTSDIHDHSEPEFPTLVGHGCEGVGDTSQPLYAYEEDAFPFCESIVATNPFNNGE